MKKVFLFILLVFALGVRPVFSEEPKHMERLADEEINQMRLISEAYFKMQHHYYKEIPMSSLEKFLFRAEIIAATILKNVSDSFNLELDRLIYGTLEWMVLEMRDSSDELSKFIHKKFVKRVIRENLVSKFGGIGIEVEKKEGVFLVRKVYKDSSAEEEGVRLNDSILKINNEAIADLTLVEVEKLLALPDGATVILSLIHEGEAEMFQVTLVSRIIVIPSVVSEFYEKEKAGYIRVAEFRNETGKEVEAHIDLMLKKKAQGLILDLRGNDGGNMEQAIALCDLFLPSGKLICFFLKRNVGRQDQRTQHPPKDLKTIEKIIFLVDNKSGSSSEIVVGALRHHLQLPIIGVKTKGMGSLKNSIGLSDGSLLYLITSRTFLPDEKTFDMVGIVPDFLIENPDEQLNKALEFINPVSINN